MNQEFYDISTLKSATSLRTKMVVTMASSFLWDGFPNGAFTDPGDTCLSDPFLCFPS